MINVLMNFKSDISSDLFYNKLKDIIKKDMKIVVILFSFFEEEILTKEEYDKHYENIIEAFKNIYSRYGINDISIINYYSDTKESALNKINNADIVVLPGGAPDQFMNRLNEFDLIDKSLYENKIIIGSSAGAMIQLDVFHISPDRDYKKYSIHNGLGLLKNIKVEVHYNKRLKQIISFNKTIKRYEEIGFLIPNGSGLIYKDNKYILLNKTKVVTKYLEKR